MKNKNNDDGLDFLDREVRKLRWDKIYCYLGFVYCDILLYRYVYMKKVVIARGIPGSGKSTYIKENLPNAYVCSADHYHINKDGFYDWKPENAAKAHFECRRKFEEALKDSIPLVVVDNTNTTMREMKHYANQAQAYGYEIECVRIDTPLEIAASRNQHNVPYEVIKAMHNRMCEVPKEWNEKVIKQ